MGRRSLILLCFLVASNAFGNNTGTIAFPGAEGYGRFAQGGRGGDVCAVTNLQADGKGVLRYGIENQLGPRTIVFAVSGTISLKSELRIKQSSVEQRAQNSG